MQNFTYFAPTKIIFGKDTHKNVGEIIKGYGFSKIMMQYGKGSIKKSGLYDEVIASLVESGITVVEMGGVQANPTLDFVHNAIEVARKEKVEMILAVGGGSVIDSCKSTAAGVFYQGDVWDFHSRKASPQKSLPVATILTIAAAGSEMSASAVVSNEELNMKRGFGSEHNRCLFSILNPELTFSVSKYQTACGIVDIMAHTMERYFTNVEDTLITDSIAEAILKTVIKSGKVLMENPCDYDARANVMWASSLSHNDLTGCGRQHYLAVHQLEHALSGEFTEIAHGAGLAVLFPAWAKYVYKHNVKRFAQFARNVWDVAEADDELAAAKGIEEMAKFFEFIGMPTRLRDFGISENCTEKLTNLCTFQNTRVVNSYIDLGSVEIKAIFDSCF